MTCASASSYARDVCSANNVETLTKELALDIDISQFDEAATRQQLATLYGIDASLISLTATGGSVQLTVTIATSSTGTGPALALADLVTAVTAADDATLAATLGVPVTSLSTPQLSCSDGFVQSTNVDGSPMCTPANLLASDRSATCPAGKFELGGECLPCRRGSYCVGGKEISCNAGKWLNATGAANETSCKTCPSPGVECKGGDQIRVLRGYYMQTPLDATAYLCASDDACLGGIRFGEDSCAAGHVGNLCGKCADGFYRSQRRCLSCAALEEEAGGSDSADPKLATVIAIVVVCIFGPLLTLTYLQPPPSLIQCLKAIGTATRISDGLITAAALAKLLISYCQCIGALNRISGIHWPNDFLRFMKALDRAFNLELFSVLPVECIKGSPLSFYVELLVALLLPIAIVLSLVLVVASHRRLAMRRGWKLEGDGNGSVSAPGWAGLGTALLRPRVCKVLIWVRLALAHKCDQVSLPSDHFFLRLTQFECILLHLSPGVSLHLSNSCAKATRDL